MRWINKSTGRYRKRGRRIVEYFLDKAWNDSEGQYVNCDFDSFKREREFRRLLIEQQDRRCCYCMRRLEDNLHTTLEHIMPHQSEDAEVVKYYMRYNRNMRRFVMYCHIKEQSLRKIYYPPYPHFCAYENLVASCDGTIPDSNHNELPVRVHLCCNNPQGNKKIIPLFFIRKISKIIIYE